MTQQEIFQNMTKGDISFLISIIFWAVFYVWYTIKLLQDKEFIRVHLWGVHLILVLFLTVVAIQLTGFLILQIL